MKTLEYIGLDTSRVEAQYNRIRAAIERDDFSTIDVKKLAGIGHGKFFRAKLDYANRLLFSIISYQGEAHALLLEVIEQHAYEKSRFLRGAVIDEDKIPAVAAVDAAKEAEPVRYLHPERRQVHLLDKVISFDAAQQAIYQLTPPLIIVGSAGSGKTALTLEKLKLADGEVLYVTHSAFLAQSARDLYYAHGFEREGQEASFLSYRDFLETLRVPPGREALWRDFVGWFARMRQQFKAIDPHQAFEEIRGVLGADAAGVLTREQYLALGVRQSIFPLESRAALYDLFEKYREWLRDANLYDLNLIAQQWADMAVPSYDFVVVDEVQDLTSVQLALVLKTLRKSGHFLLCGDSNQIVHPNFFSWSKVKTLFWRDSAMAEQQELRILQANFRNGSEVTRLANTLLKIKHQRFGSIDRESNFLVQAISGEGGSVSLLNDGDKTTQELNKQTRRSTRVAVLVLRDEDKAEAHKHFDTPLVFAVHEAKGLEYESVVLYRCISNNRSAYAEVAAGVSGADLAGAELAYRRGKDKSDKSLEIYKFYINALYVALTRATHHVWLIESDTAHPLLALLGLKQAGAAPAMAAHTSSLEEWQKEARRLELQGKQEQADAIRQQILKTQPVPWPVFDEVRLRDNLVKVFRDAVPGTKPRQQLFEYAACYDEPLLAACLEDYAGFATARSYAAQRAGILARHLGAYAARNFKEVLRQCDLYGLEHRSPLNLTPLMAAAAAGNVALVEALLDRGADSLAHDHLGRNALHWALLAALRDAKYAQTALPALYERLAPPVLDLKIGDRLLRLDRHVSEYFLFQLMWVLCKSLYATSLGRGRVAFDAGMLHGVCEKMPLSVVRLERRNRQYISSVLSRNEIDRDYAYNRHLFVRIRTGWYRFNPQLALRRTTAQSETWEPWAQALNLALIKEIAPGDSGAVIDRQRHEAGLPPAPRTLPDFWR